jgi:hypothetical protein
VGERFKPRILESFDPTTKELYRLLPATIHTQETKEIKGKIKTFTTHCSCSGGPKQRRKGLSKLLNRHLASLLLLPCRQHLVPVDKPSRVTAEKLGRCSGRAGTPNEQENRWWPEKAKRAQEGVGCQQKPEWKPSYAHATCLPA